MADCGSVKEVKDDYVTCSAGTTVCEGGKWSKCTGERHTDPAALHARRRPLTLGSPEECAPGFDSCDPYCNVTVDSPGDFETGPGFLNDPEGLTLVGTGFPECETLTLTPSSDTMIVTSFDPLETDLGEDISFTLSVDPPDCAEPPFATTWVVDKVDRASIAGNSSDNGELTLAVPIGGEITVTAYALGLETSTNIDVRVNVLDPKLTSSDAAPNVATTSSIANAFGPWDNPNAGNYNTSAVWLYPYEDTYFPLGLPAPVLQYRYTSTSGGSSRTVKASLRYPVGETATSAVFNYSLVISEGNVVSRSAGVASNNLDPQVVIPQEAWEYFEQTARGEDAELVVQRRRGSRLEREQALTVHFVDGQLKGEVYYNSYTSPKGGNTGAVLRIAPGATEPTLAVQPRSSGGTPRCVVCHSINSDGSRLIANGQRPSGGVWFNNSQLFDISDVSTFPQPPALTNYDAAGGVDTENTQGNRFTFGGPWMDGSLYMTHGGKNSGSDTGDNNWRAPPGYSELRRTSNPNSAVSVNNWPNNMIAVTPRFSMDGTKLAFGYWDGSSLPRSPSGNLSSSSSGRRLAVVDFSCSSPPCTSSSSGWTVSNARDVTPTISSGLNNTSGTLKIAWPSFTPGGNSVVYQRQYRTSRSYGDGGVLSWGWSPSDINTVAGALAEIWMSDVPANGSTAATPTRLLALNGLDSSGNSYLPEYARTISPVPFHYHEENASFTITQADSCSNTGWATNVYDHRLNYLPNMSPVQAGNMNWVIFTSRRMYGNVAFDDPWDAEPGFTCNSGNPQTKKLWVSALDKDWTPGEDPSHPAFYLPGQELVAGNSDAYWVASQCLDIGEACETNDDCCGGVGDMPTTSCKVVSTSTVPPTRECQSLDSCSGVGQACDVTADCCAGLTCPPGGGVCFSQPQAIYEQQTLAREYEAECPVGTHVAWRFFEWQSTIPDGTWIDFSIQTREQDADDYEPELPRPMSASTATTGMDSWVHGVQTAEEVLEDGDPMLTSRRQLKVTMTFNPNDDGSLAPTLHGWRQLFDCLPAE